jgi:hypothetical protein
MTQDMTLMGQKLFIPPISLLRNSDTSAKMFMNIGQLFNNNVSLQEFLTYYCLKCSEYNIIYPEVFQNILTEWLDNE